MNSHNDNIKATSYREKMIQLIQISGGELDDSNLFVMKPGCTILNMTQEIDRGEEI